MNKACSERCFFFTHHSFVAAVGTDLCVFCFAYTVPGFAGVNMVVYSITQLEVILFTLYCLSCCGPSGRSRPIYWWPIYSPFTPPSPVMLLHIVFSHQCSMGKCNVYPSLYTDRRGVPETYGRVPRTYPKLFQIRYHLFQEKLKRQIYLIYCNMYHCIAIQESGKVGSLEGTVMTPNHISFRILKECLPSQSCE